jgi:hypothetical protein
MILRSRRLSRLAAVVTTALVATLAGPVAPAPAATAVTRVASSSSGSSASRTSITLARPTGTVPGHVMVASIVANEIASFTAPPGWTLIRNDAVVEVLRQAVYVKIAGSSEPTSYVWTLPDWRRVAGGITTYAGVDTAHPVDTHGASTEAGDDTAVTAPSITPSVPDTRLVHFAAVRAEGTLRPPAGMTERWEKTSPNSKNTSDVTASSSDSTQAGTGPTGARTAIATKAGPRIGAVLALRPAGSTPPPDPDPDPDPPDPGGDPVLVGAGDIADCNSTGDEATAALLDDIPGTVFTIGDAVYPNGTAAEFAQCYEPSWGRHKARTALAVSGNHEYKTPGAGPHFDYFGAAAGPRDKGYFDTRIGAWHVIVLNGNCDAIGGCGAGSDQEQWLRAVLAASDAECTVALWHQPRFSSATREGAFPAYEPFWRALYEYGADVVLAGHDHVYERFGLQTPSGVSDTAYGLRQFTVGSGGKSSQAFRAALPNSEVRNGATYGVIKLTLHPDSYDWQFVPVAGKTFTDSGTTPCHGAPPPVPAAEPGPVTRVASASNGSASARSSITVARPAGTAPGQAMVASIVSNDDGPAFSAPAGWSIVREDSIPDTLRQTIYVKVAGPSEPASYTWTLSQYRRVAGGITTYSGVDPAQPIDAHDAMVTPVSGTAVTAPSITTTVADTMLIHFAAIGAEGSLTTTGDLTERWEAAAPTSADARDVLVSSSDAPRPGAGPTGFRSVLASRNGARIAALVALRPAL